MSFSLCRRAERTLDEMEKIGIGGLCLFGYFRCNKANTCRPFLKKNIVAEVAFSKLQCGLVLFKLPS